MAEELVAFGRGTKVGDGFVPQTMLGPVQNRLRYQRLQLAWEQIAGSGTQILFRGSVPTNSEGFFFPVTLLENPRESAVFLRTAVCGPIAPVFKSKRVY